MAPRATSSTPQGPLYSVLLPTYNERENLPLMVELLDTVFTAQCVCGGATDANN